MFAKVYTRLCCVLHTIHAHTSPVLHTTVRYSCSVCMFMMIYVLSTEHSSETRDRENTSDASEHGGPSVRLYDVHSVLHLYLHLYLSDRAACVCAVAPWAQTDSAAAAHVDERPGTVGPDPHQHPEASLGRERGKERVKGMEGLAAPVKRRPVVGHGHVHLG